jgi:uncharacterized protein (TIGR00299 family) protein
MRIAYLDCFSGISGDMFMGALLDAGVPQTLLEETVAALNSGARLEVSRVTRSGISAVKVDVYAHGEKDLPREVYWEQQGGGSHQEHHEHAHSHRQDSHESEHACTAVYTNKPIALMEHNYALGTSAEPGPRERSIEPREIQERHSAADREHGHQHERRLKQIREIIMQAAISAKAKNTATAIFQALGAAEAKIHDTGIEKIHFHEVGAVDAIVDIVCAAVGAEVLGVDEIVCSPLNVGGGTVQCAHGTLPIPAPATLEMLQTVPVYSSGIQAELVTPTGAAIVKILAKRFAAFPPMKIEKAGYGAGTRDFSGHANVVRLTLGEAQPEATAAQTINVIETNIDDLNPQVFGYVMDRLLEEGALDAFGMPVLMKKNRPGMLLTVLCRPEDAAKLTQLIFAETTTIGVRQREEKRQELERTWTTVATGWGNVRVKVANRQGSISNYAPEYEDCRRIASERRVPLKQVMQAAIQEYLRMHPPGEI